MRPWASSDLWNNTIAAVTQPTRVMSISALGTLSSHSTEHGSSTAISSAARSPSTRRNMPCISTTASAAANTDGSRALAALTSPNGRLHTPMAA